MDEIECALIVIRRDGSIPPLGLILPRPNEEVPCTLIVRLKTGFDWAGNFPHSVKGVVFALEVRWAYSVEGGNLGSLE